MDDHALRLYIRAKLENGHLPQDGVPYVWGGPGSGGTCDGCEETVTKHQLGMDGVGITGDKVQFHVKCFYVWAAEQTDLSDHRELNRRSSAPSHAPPAGTPIAGP